MAVEDASGKFGNCCENLKDAIAGEDFEPLIAVDEDGILYMSVGLLGLDGKEPEANTIDYPIFFCPFCGSKLQTPEEIDAKTSSSN